MWNKRVLAKFLAAVICAGALSACVSTAPPPPPERVVVVPAQPYPDAVWVAGHWRWHPWLHRYSWVPGHWKVRRHSAEVIIRER